MAHCNWTDYMKYRAQSRGYDLGRIEDIVKRSHERYFDTETRRAIADREVSA